MSSAKIVLGLGFGDEGKGITTDFLCLQNPNSIVIRFSGGQQAAHTVMINGLKHVHSSYGSGALRGLPTYISEHCLIHPTMMYNEALELETKGGNTSIFIHPLAKVTTPFDVWHNQSNAKNLLHGTCGKGIGATMKRNEGPYKLYAIDLKAPRPFLVEKLKQIGLYYGIAQNEKSSKELGLFLEAIDLLNFEIADYSILKSYPNLIFEGSQGILLDMNHGIFPYVTYANTTSKNAIEICQKLEIHNPEIYYVTRCYASRHGNGWMLNEENISLSNNEEETCTFNEFQKDLRLGIIDEELLIHSKNIDQIYSKTQNTTLVITCLDQFIHSLDFNKLKTHFNHIIGSYSPDSCDFKEGIHLD